MRLGQLSRKLGQRISDIQQFLTERSQVVDPGPNTRLTDEQVLMVVRRFDPSQEAAILKEEALSDAVEEAVAAETVPEVEPTPSQEILPEAELSESAQIESVPEVIRAPKQELPGLKVVGKIELKEPKKKEEPETTESVSADQPEPRTPRPPRPIRQERQPRSWKNPLEAERQREAQEREEKRQRQLELDKERRTQKYLKKVKSAPTKPVRRQEEAVVETQVETRPAPKTWLGKIARWLTS